MSGVFFQDHLGGRLAYIRPRNAKAFYDAFCTAVLKGYKFQPKVRLSNETLQHENDTELSSDDRVRELGPRKPRVRQAVCEGRNLQP